MRTAWILGISFFILVFLVACAPVEKPADLAAEGSQASAPEEPQPSAGAQPTATTPPTTVQPQAPAVPDCGANADCFLSYLKECKPAKGTYDSPTTTRIFEIKGVKEKTVCNVRRTSVSQSVVEEDCVARNDQQLFGGQGYYTNQRSMAYFEVADCARVTPRGY